MKKAVNLRLDESIIVSIEHLSRELNTTKTDVIEKAIKLFSKTKKDTHNDLLKFARTLDESTATKMIDDITNSKDSKKFTMEI